MNKAADLLSETELGFAGAETIWLNENTVLPLPRRSKQFQGRTGAKRLWIAKNIKIYGEYRLEGTDCPWTDAST